MPGAQPRFQKATLLPAIRSALALGCEIQRKSGWDRKHYFHWDQPNGYQITQYYSPFAKDGAVVLTAEDGVLAADLDANGELRVGVKQVQMEQDTAKTIAHGNSYHVDLNRAGLPLIEVISLPHIHSPQAAAAYVRKVQGALKAVDACTTGMEAGGLRADVNVSIKGKGEVGRGEYSGVVGLGQRTEIKNLSSFRAVEDAIVAERDRQIAVLESGGFVEGETRGWTLGDTETRRLRGKEGEVDYRYMPDADLPPLFIGNDLVQMLRETLPELPDRTVARVAKEYGITLKDARTLASLDDGDRLEFMEEVVASIIARLPQTPMQVAAKAATNWILMELGGLLTTSNTNWQEIRLTSQELADLIANVLDKQITARVAKQLLAVLVENKDSNARPSADVLIDEGDLRLQPLSEEEYRALAQKVIDGSPGMVAAVVEKGQKGKLMWFVGQMVRNSKEGTVEPQKAREVIEALLLPG
ncbi:putative glutamyl-tRNA [Polychaeton citri CBS 116435]|uniref:Glutamyl-tRNA n=1 Tax=Polychaeton citri CBS 116435 TaxID=1314669 RepID=A0A9P4Q084_9PEZI|nr:putative glutamyl-tRNA [Polychaeton citri CBS 116435]